MAPSSSLNAAPGPLQDSTALVITSVSLPLVPPASPHCDSSLGAPSSYSMAAGFEFCLEDISPPSSTRLLCLDLFTGMDGLGYALDGLGLQSLRGDGIFTILFETDPRCRRLLAHHRSCSGTVLSSSPDPQGVVGSVFALLQDSGKSLRHIISSCSSLEVVLIAGGSPCVGFSRANQTRAGALDRESCKIWIFPVLCNLVKDFVAEIFPTSTPLVVFLLENVDMSDTPSDLANRDAISATMGVQPFLSKASLLCACERARLLWCNIRINDISAVSCDAGSLLADGWRPLWEFPSGAKRVDLRFSTFCRPFEAGKPSEFPADFARLPLHSYTDRALVYRPGASPALLSELKRFVFSSIRIKTTDLRRRGSSSQVARGDVCRWIHCSGGDEVLRPLYGWERDLALGFPRGASALPGEPCDAFAFDQLCATGNSFAVPVFIHALGPIAALLLRAEPLPVLDGFPSSRTEAAALASFTPSLKGN